MQNSANSPVKPKPHSNHQTQWAAQFAVASELCKLGYEVAMTMGNHPSVDIMVKSPLGKRFEVDVKGLYKRNFWPVRQKADNPNLFYIFAYVPAGAPNEIFVLEQSKVTEGIAFEIAKTRANKAAKGLPHVDTQDFPCVSWTFAAEHSGGWKILPP
jgi:hypothetical protein